MHDPRGNRSRDVWTATPTRYVYHCATRGIPNGSFATYSFCGFQCQSKMFTSWGPQSTHAIFATRLCAQCLVDSVKPNSYTCLLQNNHALSGEIAKFRFKKISVSAFWIAFSICSLHYLKKLHTIISMHQGWVEVFFLRKKT